MIEDNEVDLDTQNINGSTALHAACQHKLENVTKVLLDSGANPNLQESFYIGGRAPIHIAVENDCYEIVRMLLDAGCSPNCLDGYKNSP
jgi:ankyrin repeat protein